MTADSPAAADRVRTLAVRRISVRVSERPGSGGLRDEPPLLLCNGIGASFEALQPLVSSLDPRRGVVRFDVPGVGGSPPPPLPYTMPALASWVSALMKRLGHDRFDVLGLSWGGGLAQQLGFQAPRRVRRLVLVATGTGSLMVPAHPRVLATMLTPRRHRDPAYAARVASGIYGGTMRTDPERGRRCSTPPPGPDPSAATTSSCSPAPAGRACRPSRSCGSRRCCWPATTTRSSRWPTRAIMHRLLPHSRLHVYRGGHLGVVTESDELAPIIEDFLTSPDPISPTTTTTEAEHP